MNPQKRIGDDSATEEIKNKKQRDSNAAVEVDNSSEDTTFVFPFKTEMAKLCREKDWSKTKLGPTNKWPQSLRTAASICLNNRFPSLVMWGPELIQLYNEGYCDVLENRHPSALGTPCSETWWDIWDVIEPMFNQVITTGQSLFLKDYLLHIRNQDGIRAERYFTYSYSPIYIENAKVGGVLNTVTETTDKIFNERQLRTLREIASHTTEATTIIDACRILASTLSTNPYDIFFASIYLGESNHLRLTETVNVEKGTDISPCEVGDSTVYTSANQAIFAKTLLQVASTDTPLQFDLTSFQAPKSSVWINAPFDKDPVFTRTCKMLPIASTKHGTTMGVIVIGISPMRPYDESYSSFLRLIAGQTSAVIGNARAHEEERQKAEMLAELDRAKTLFFSNISHEFRTPITLMLGPIEDLILKEKTTEDKSLLVQLELIHRNALRLLKLVNTLLDFSRIEAGRMEATFEPVDISQVTHDLASVFRSACERVGLDLIVECPPVSEMVFIDNDMYEKILLNLVSNAYKFCMRGHIAVKVKELGKQAVQISVEDTGTGIPDDEVPRLFERFHRVPESKGRTHEGTGIGLAMVNELVKLHGGTIQVYSKLGQGSIFIVTLPYGTHHLPAERVKEPNQSRKQTYVRTAEWWIGPNQTAITSTPSSDISPNKSRILIVDDNADMREYLQNLLSDTYDLEVAYDGLHALELISRRLPELVLTDIMMPRMDGFGLVQKLREDQKTKTIPVIFLSARAGEEARVEGLKFGADDYLTKPFTARELLARIKTHLELFQIRQEAAIRAEAANRAKDHFLAVLSHELRTPLTPALLLSESLQSDESLPEKVRLDLELITKNIKLEVKLIDDLLDVTKITKNKLVLNLKQVDAHNELQHTLNLVKHDALEKQIQFETYFNAHSYHLEADPSRLQQIFWNIVKNAVKFTPENGRIEITTRNDDMGMLRVEVKDSGIGIDIESLPKIFESFQQGAQSITNQFGGLGLGLSISRALCAMMSGTISATSDGPGCGSTFFVMFPTISIRDAPVPTPLQTTIESPIPPQHILLTEDNKSTALVMTRFLKKLGHEVKTAYCIKEALDIAANHKFDLVISDVGLPDGSGFDLMKSLHSMYGLRGICVTGYGMEDDIRRSKEVGFDIHVVKPIEIQSLQNAIAFVVKMIQSRNV